MRHLNNKRPLILAALSFFILGEINSNASAECLNISIIGNSSANQVAPSHRNGYSSAKRDWSTEAIKRARSAGKDNPNSFGYYGYSNIRSRVRTY